VNDKGLTYSTKQDDFFPYGSDSQTYWTGYFTSRPTIKYFERLGNNFLQVTNTKDYTWRSHCNISFFYVCRFIYKLLHEYVSTYWSTRKCSSL